MEKVNMNISVREFGKFNLVVVGGGCAGVFAAVRAARMGLKVAIIEKSNCFGGVATSGLVNVWHSLYDIYGDKQIIGGLTDEMEQRLISKGYAELENTRHSGIRFDPNAMKWALDKLAVENGIKVFFHTFYSTMILKDRFIDGIVVGNKDGLGVIYSDFFIDATGDGDLCRDTGIESYTSDTIQPPSPCCFLSEEIKGDLGKLVLEHGKEFGLDDDWGWSGKIPGLDNINFRADFHIFGKMCNVASELTEAEIEGREKLYALLELLKKYDDPKHALVSICSQIGIRETTHYKTVFKANERDLLIGKAYENTVMKGSYRIDIHHKNDNGITFKYLDGRTETIYGKENKTVWGNWREAEGITGEPAAFYQIPFEILVQEKIDNLIPVGRMLNADEGSFGALRVMVNLNQLGEAAGTAAGIAVSQGKSISEICASEVISKLISGGSLL